MTRKAVSREAGVQSLQGWWLTPEGAAIHPHAQIAVIADLHLGYEWARGAAGDCVIAHSLNETLERLAAVLDRATITRLVVAGDLVESPRLCCHTADDVRRLGEWLAERRVSLLVVEGNHDRSPRNSAREMMPVGVSWSVNDEVAGWTIGHGHEPVPGLRTISGHHHPVFRHAGKSAPCFLVGPGRIVLPAFSANAAGYDVATAAIPADWRTSSLRCLVSTGGELLDFGPLTSLRRRLRLLVP